MGENFKKELDEMKISYDNHIRNLDRIFGKQEQKLTKLHIMTEVNGKSFELAWVHNDIGYELCFPGIKTDSLDYDGPEEDGIFDSFVRVGKDDEEALSMFNRAVELAKGKDDLRTIYKKIEREN